MSGERLNPQALTAALKAHHDHKADPGRKGCGIEKAIRAYLAASPSPSETDELSERLLSAAKDVERSFLHRIDHSGEDWRLVNPDGETAAAIMREAQSALAAMREKLAIAERNRDAGRDNFHTIRNPY